MDTERAYLQTEKPVQIGTIQSNNSNRALAFFLGAAVTFIIGWFSLKIHDFSPISYLDTSKLIEILVVIPTMLFILFVHEMIHVIFFHLFGKGRAKIEVKIDKEIGAVIMHQVNSEVYYRRNEMLAILLAPLILISVVLVLLDAYILFPFLLWVNILLNAIGSSTDIYISYRLLKEYSSNDLINFDSSKHILNVYKSNMEG